MKNIKLHIFLLLGFITTSLIINAQIRVIDNKGTVSTIDASKWTRIGTTNDIYDKFPGNVGIGTTTPIATLHNAGSTLLGVTDVSLMDPTYLPTAQATVDAYSGIVITQQSTDLALTLPTPTATTAGRLFTVSNSITSTNYVKVSSCTLPAGMSVTLIWDGTQWSAPLASPITVVNNSNLFSTGLASTGSGVTSTSNSNFLGLGAGYDATGASNSNFLGSGAGGIAMGASYSNFFGQNAGYNAITANNSNFLGQNAGQAATNASGANFLGSNTGYAASGATYSNFIGNNAGQWATNASYSTLLGYNVANENSLGTHIGSNNIIIGTNITLPATTANGINIGGVLFGLNTYSTTSGNPSSVATGSGKIGIGIVSPTAHLHLAASSGASGTAPLKLSAGTNLSTTEAGTIEYNGTHLYFTAINGGPRYQIDGQGLSLPLSSLTAAVATNNITNGDYDQTWNWNSSTTKSPFTIASNSLTLGNLFSLTNSNASHTGNLLALTSNTTMPTGGIVKFNFTGNHTGNGLEIDDVTTSGAAVAINANALTTGTALNISSASTTITGGQLLNVATSGVNVSSGSTTTAATISNTHGGDTPTNVGLTVSAGGGLKNYALLVPSGYVGIGTNTPAAALDVKGQINITQASGTGSVGLVAPATLTGYTLTLPSAQSSNGQILQNDGLGNLSWVSGLTNSLTAGNINVGNSSGVATPVSVSGDATLANDGTLTLKPIISSGSYGSATSIPTFTVDTKGRVTAASNVTPSGTWGINITGNAATVVTNANLTGEVTSVGNATTVTNPAVIGKVLTGYVKGTGTISASDNILQAIQKLDGNNATNANLTGMVTSVGNAATVVTNANLTGPITSSGNTTSVASQTGTGSTFVMNTSPVLVTPNLGTPTALVGTNITGTANGLNIGGNAATASSLANFTSNPNRTDGNDYSLAARTTGIYAIAGVGTNGPGAGYLSLIHAANASDVAFQIAGGYVSDNMYFRGTSALQNGTGYTPWRTVLHSGNFNSYSPTLTGGGASGTWGINITGNAATATTATNWSGSGALGNYLPLTGGTLTGGLSGTTANFTGTVTASTLLFPPPAGDPSPVITARTVPAGQGAATEKTELILFHSNDNASSAGIDQITLRAPGLSFQTYNDPSVNDINNNNGYNVRLYIDPTGLATFSNSVTASSFSGAGTGLTGTAAGLNIGGTATYGRYAYNNGAYSGSGWVEPSDLGVRYANSAGTATNWSGSGALGSYLPLSGGTLTGGLTGTTESLSGNLTVSSGNTTGGGIILADDGDIVDMNDAYCSMRFSAGVRIFSANRGGSPVITLANNGDITASGNVTAYSDIRLKKNIRTLSPVSASLRKINAVEFDRKDITLHQLGFIAQNVQQYFPDLVTVAKDSMATLSLNYQAMTAPLLKGWQEHDEIIVKQQGEIEGLTKEIAVLKESIEELKKAIADKK